jgi:DNA-directed RNA polymerase II subunit RPB7
MFLYKHIRHEIELDPRYLGKHLVDHIRARVAAELEGQCVGKHGYIIKLMELKDESIVTDQALINNDSGAVTIICECEVLVLRPFRYEVVDAIVIDTNPEGILTAVGPVRIFVSKMSMGTELSFDENTGDRWVSEDGRVEIRDSVVVRLRIMGLEISDGKMVAVGTIKEPYLGLVGDTEY